MRPEQFQFDVVFRALPADTIGLSNACRDGGSCDVLESQDNRCNQGVLIPIACVVECPQRRIASVVSLERPKQRSYFFGDRSAPIHCVIESGRIASKWEATRSELRIDMPIDDGAGVNGMVQSGPCVVDGISNENCKIVKDDGIRQSHFVDFVSGFRIFIFDQFVRVINPERIDKTFQIADVMLCSVDL
jgi:hypothetical protein